VNGSFEFENSKVTDVFISETSFPKSVYLNNSQSPSQSRLVFGQLATAFKNQGDNINALEYQSREFESHYNGLRLWSKSFFEVVNLWLNKWSNNFGRSWQRGVLFTVGVGILLFYFLVISSKEYTIAFGINIRNGMLPAFLKFMNPLRFFDTESLFKIQPESQVITLTSTSYFWDFLGRIVIAYGYYQTIQAFRRYGRK
jgi:hypothetical protein